MSLSCHSNASASELRHMLMGDDILPGDINGLHTAVIVLCDRVAELEAALSLHQKNRFAHDPNSEDFEGGE